MHQAEGTCDRVFVSVPFHWLILSHSYLISRELKRLSSVTLSPVYAHFSESLAGLSTIRALRASDRFIAENEARVNVNQRANFGSKFSDQFVLHSVTELICIIIALLQ